MAEALADIHVRVNKNIKTESEAVLNQIGISFSDLFNMTLRRVVYERRIPFSTDVSNATLPANMRIDTEAEFKQYLERSIKEDDGTRFTIDEIRESILGGK